MPMPIDHALGHAGGAGSKQDRGNLVGCGRGQLRPGASAPALQGGQARPGKPEAPNTHALAHMAAAPAQNPPRPLRQRDAADRLWLRFAQALLERAAINARIDTHRPEEHTSELTSLTP